LHGVTRVICLNAMGTQMGQECGLCKTKREEKAKGIQLPWGDCTAERANC
jgi:hypothetical protein